MNASVATEALTLRLSSHSRATSSARGLTVCSAGKRQQQFELHVCTNKTCKKQGSKEVELLHSSQIKALHTAVVGAHILPSRHICRTQVSPFLERTGDPKGSRNAT